MSTNFTTLAQSLSIEALMDEGSRKAGRDYNRAFGAVNHPVKDAIKLSKIITIEQLTTSARIAAKHTASCGN
ncbi:hypothetical protein G8770_06620 [Aestuariicella hydrocarbonica]|uniref:Uncharacterized protein n=1 Tax=Pseudomaricurvus hydrocarbonicus TaxID=1470433 RepID=A0A9E5JUN1_9GAMM|nr:hypothetical protein [Aestuariicella hydrocarbonica]NHO65215.1 hypothetical protein [Aestuariicella hydrocarbonica]